MRTLEFGGTPLIETTSLRGTLTSATMIYNCMLGYCYATVNSNIVINYRKLNNCFRDMYKFLIHIVHIFHIFFSYKEKCCVTIYCTRDLIFLVLKFREINPPFASIEDSAKTMYLFINYININAFYVN